MLPVQPSKLETLDELLTQTEHCANYSMRNMGRLPLTLFLIGSNGSTMFMPESLTDDNANNDFAASARLIYIAHAVTAVVMALRVQRDFTTPIADLLELWKDTAHRFTARRDPHSCTRTTTLPIPRNCMNEKRTAERDPRQTLVQSRRNQLITKENRYAPTRS